MCKKEFVVRLNYKSKRKNNYNQRVFKQKSPNCYKGTFFSRWCIKVYLPSNLLISATANICRLGSF